MQRASGVITDRRIYSGELIKWDILNKNKQTKFAIGHSRSIFNISTCLYNGHSNLYTISMDRAVSIDFQAKKTLIFEIDNNVGRKISSKSVGREFSGRLCLLNRHQPN